MAIETEIKYRLNKAQFEQVREDLKEFEAEFLGEVFEENIIYSGESLESINAVLRIRKIGETTILTFKKRLPSEAGIKHQIEHETKVEDADELEKIIDNLGFEKRLIYEKCREIWKLREVEILLDKLPFGLYLEIEGTLMAIKEAEMILEADGFEIEHKTYPNLTSELGIQHGNFIEARF